jgi:thiol-disulfide isomerase/thioredoxin
MAASSTMLPLGTPLPAFELANVVDGRAVASSTLAGKPLLVMFICNHCPYVVHVRDELGRIARDYQPRGVTLVAINSNSVATHPEDGPGPMKELAALERWTFPFLFDEAQDVARLFQAACTPEFYLFDAAAHLVYRGQLDDSRPGNGKPVTGRDLRAALDAVLAGQAPAGEQRPSVGCSIKWHTRA